MKVSSIFRLALFSLVAIIILSCSEPPKKKITIGNETWAVNRALTYLTKNVLEEKGYEVEVKEQTIEQIFRNLGHGHLDLYMDAWLRGHDVYLFEYQDLLDIGKIYHGCKFGLAVPSYFDVDSIHQLKFDSLVYENSVYGVTKDAGVMIATKEALHANHLNPNIINMEEDQFVKQLEILVDKKENFVTAAWKPHWKIKYFDLKFLVDSSGTYGTTDEIHAIARAGFEKEYPEVVKILGKMYLNDDIMTDLLMMMKDAKNEEQRIAVSKEFMEKNRDLINTWIK